MTSADTCTMWSDHATADFESTFPVVNGVRTRVLTAGSGPVLVLLHCTGGHLETYQKNVTELSAHFRVIVPDMIGHGYTDRPDVDYTLDDYADHLFALLDHFDAPTAYLSGESIGGSIVAPAGRRSPARARTLT